METTIEEIVEIIKSYREDELEIKIDKDHIKTWVNQFEEEDREFILAELSHLLPKSYISKEYALRKLNSLFDTLKNDYQYKSVEELLDHTCFLHCQPSYKSQSILLNFLNRLASN